MSCNIITMVPVIISRYDLILPSFFVLNKSKRPDNTKMRNLIRSVSFAFSKFGLSTRDGQTFFLTYSLGNLLINNISRIEPINNQLRHESVFGKKCRVTGRKSISSQISSWWNLWLLATLSAMCKRRQDAFFFQYSNAFNHSCARLRVARRH